LLGGLLSLLSAITFAYANASVRRGVLSGTVLQAVGVSLPIALPIFALVMWPIGGFAALAAFDARSLDLLIVAGVIHFAWGRYCNYKATKAIGANLVAPVQQYSLILTLALAVLWLGEPLTVLRIVGIALVVAGPSLTLKPEPKASAEVTPAIMLVRYDLAYRSDSELPSTASRKSPPNPPPGKTLPSRM